MSLNQNQFRFYTAPIAAALCGIINTMPFPLSLSSPSLAVSLGLRAVFVGPLDNLPAPDSIGTYLNGIYIGYVRKQISTAPLDGVPVVLMGGNCRVVVYHYRLLYLRRILQATIDAGTPAPDLSADTAVVADIDLITAALNAPMVQQLTGTAIYGLPGIAVLQVKTTEDGIDQEWSRMFRTIEYQTGVGYIDIEVATQAVTTDPGTWT